MLLLGLQVEVLTVTQAYYFKFKLLELEIVVDWLGVCPFSRAGKQPVGPLDTCTATEIAAGRGIECR